ncbi:tonB-dependent Receptor Plug domain protein, partial [Yersinia pestis PY-58]
MAKVNQRFRKTHSAA